MMTTLPSLFVGHGAPSLAIEPSPGQDFLRTLPGLIPPPRAIVVASAHWSSSRQRITAAAKPDTIHDFAGFAPELFDMRYPAPGDPELACAIEGILKKYGFDPVLDDKRGYDHGAWVPLSLAWPEAEIPLLQVAIDERRDAAWHVGLGAALAPLAAEGVLLVGSGSVTHNLRAFFSGGYRLGDPAPDWTMRFADWLADMVANGHTGEIAARLGEAPMYTENHPTPEHLLPFFVALGAGGKGAAGRALHRSTTYGVLAMDAYAFGPREQLAGLEPMGARYDAA